MSERVHEWKTFTNVDATKETRICRVCGVCDETLAAVSTGRDWRRLAEEREAALDTMKGQLARSQELLELAAAVLEAKGDRLNAVVIRQYLRHERWEP